MQNHCKCLTDAACLVNAGSNFLMLNSDLIRALSWKIVDTSDRDYLLTFLTEEEFLSLNGIFGSVLEGWQILAPAAERCLRTLTKVKEMSTDFATFVPMSPHSPLTHSV